MSIHVQIGRITQYQKKLLEFYIEFKNFNVVHIMQRNTTIKMVKRIYDSCEKLWNFKKKWRQYYLTNIKWLLNWQNLSLLNYASYLILYFSEAPKRLNWIKRERKWLIRKSLFLWSYLLTDPCRKLSWNNPNVELKKIGGVDSLSIVPKRRKRKVKE